MQTVVISRLSHLLVPADSRVYRARRPGRTNTATESELTSTFFGSCYTGNFHIPIFHGTEVGWTFSCTGRIDLHRVCQALSSRRNGRRVPRRAGGNSPLVT